MKIPKDPVKALHLVLHPQAIQKMDIGVVDYGEKSRRFAVSAGIGFDAIICHQASVSKLKAALNKIRLGKLTYAGIAIDRLIKDDSVRAEVELDKGETQVFRDTYLWQSRISRMKAVDLNSVRRRIRETENWM